MQWSVPLYGKVRSDVFVAVDAWFEQRVQRLLPGSASFCFASQCGIVASLDARALSSFWRLETSSTCVASTSNDSLDAVERAGICQPEYGISFWLQFDAFGWGTTVASRANGSMEFLPDCIAMLFDGGRESLRERLLPGSASFGFGSQPEYGISFWLQFDAFGWGTTVASRANGSMEFLPDCIAMLFDGGRESLREPTGVRNFFLAAIRCFWMGDDSCFASQPEYGISFWLQFDAFGWGTTVASRANGSMEFLPDCIAMLFDGGRESLREVIASLDALALVFLAVRD
ncbi:hypothetical protein TGRH88_048210 [Toxoplasma gondii]|uniref:Uncharacterized protein n=1 Tax=Toxoplasma gondii TaxID=5811 RepID=A0A7J6JWE3_TOXGO|nr:hypothetical protein TGRH88_048210 [Toxoplasma gondii]